MSDVIFWQNNYEISTAWWESHILPPALHRRGNSWNNCREKLREMQWVNFFFRKNCVVSPVQKWLATVNQGLAVISSRQVVIMTGHELHRWQLQQIWTIHSGMNCMLFCCPQILFSFFSFFTCGPQPASSCFTSTEKRTCQYFYMWIWITAVLSQLQTFNLQRTLGFYRKRKEEITEGGIRKCGITSEPPSGPQLSIFSTPGPGFHITDDHASNYVHLLFGLKDRNIGFVFTNLAQCIYRGFCTLEENWQQLVKDIEEGRLDSDLELDAKTRRYWMSVCINRAVTL